MFLSPDPTAKKALTYTKPSPAILPRTPQRRKARDAEPVEPTPEREGADDDGSLASAEGGSVASALAPLAPSLAEAAPAGGLSGGAGLAQYEEYAAMAFAGLESARSLMSLASAASSGVSAGSSVASKRSAGSAASSKASSGLRGVAAGAKPADAAARALSDFFAIMALGGDDSAKTLVRASHGDDGGAGDVKTKGVDGGGYDGGGAWRFASSREVELAAAPFGRDLLCEECAAPAVVRCDHADCEELLCSRCCVLVHPRRTNGADHDHVCRRFVRLALATDATGAHDVRGGEGERDAIPPWECDPEDWAERGRDTMVASAAEAPRINLVVGAASAALAPSQQSVSLDQDDVVIVNVDEVLPPDLGADGEPKPTPPWRGREMRAVVLMLPHTTNGQRGVAMRRGDGFEPQYRVRLLAPVSRDYAPECALADEAVRLRELAKNGGIDPKKRMVAAGGGTSSDLIEERRDAWMRDRRLARAQQGRSSESTHELGLPCPREDEFGAYDDEDARMAADHAVLLVPESALWRPATVRTRLLLARDRNLRVALARLDYQHSCVDGRDERARDSLEKSCLSARVRLVPFTFSSGTPSSASRTRRGAATRARRRARATTRPRRACSARGACSSRAAWSTSCAPSATTLRCSRAARSTSSSRTSTRPTRTRRRTATRWTSACTSRRSTSSTRTARSSARWASACATRCSSARPSA